MTTFYIREEGAYREASSADVIDRAQHLLRQRFRTGSPVLGPPALTRDFLKLHLGQRDSEVFGILHLTARNRLICIEDLFNGTIDSSVVYSREVVRSVLEHNTAGVICYHNHPSGEVTPSEVDQIMTERLKAALSLVDVRLIDHLIIGDGVYSFAEYGLL
ncbi:MAG: JAB domain-containing protein [Steroidobacteraceae bacterium]